MQRSDSALAVKEEIVSVVLAHRRDYPKNVFVKLQLKKEIRDFKKQDRDGFLAEMRQLVTHTDKRWPAERMWHGSQGHLCPDLRGYPTLQKYLTCVHFEPASGGEQRAESWIEFMPSGGSFGRGQKLRTD